MEERKGRGNMEERKEKIIAEGEFHSTVAFLWLGIVLIIGAYIIARIVADASADVPAISTMILGAAFIIVFFATRGFQITVTDKRVYGKTKFGTRVDLPLDSISTVGIHGFSGILVATSSGNISFPLLKNCDEIHDVISNLIIERQTRSAYAIETKPKDSQSNAGELKELKELLDSGIITQEEFDAKKKQLLGL